MGKKAPLDLFVWTVDGTEGEKQTFFQACDSGWRESKQP